MLGKTIQKRFGAFVLVCPLLTSIGSSHGVARGQAGVSPAFRAAKRVVTGPAVPRAATPIHPSPDNLYSPNLAGDSVDDLVALSDARGEVAATEAFAWG